MNPACLFAACRIKVPSQISLPWRQVAWCGLLLFCSATHADSLPFSIEAASYLIQVDQQTRWQRDADKKLPPASLTKLMTALLVLEHYQPEHMVTISPAATRETGTRLLLKSASRMSVQNLLAASLINSANDSCHALAEYVSGDEARFVQLMNQRARTWGLRATHFTNACGHDDARHYSSARDLAVLANKALLSPIILALVAQPEMTIQALDGTRYQLMNKNALIGRYDGAIGLKTGFTPKAGKCVIALVERQGVQVLAVMLDAPNRWWDVSVALDYAFSHAHPAP